MSIPQGGAPMPTDEATCRMPTGESVENAAPVRLAPALRRIAAACFLVWPLVAWALWSSSPAAALGYVFTVHVGAFYGILRPNCPLYGPVVRSFATQDKEVWLTIDDGPFPGETAAMLAVLAKHNARATFFLEGAKVCDSPSLARSIAEAGHSIGNHSHRHRVAWFWAIGPGAAQREIAGCNAALDQCGVRPIGFRPPVGMANFWVHRAARRASLPLVGWSSRGFDGVDSTPHQVLARILPDVKPGAIILLHQRQGLAPGEARNAAILDQLLTALSERGYRCVLPRPESFISA